MAEVTPTKPVLPDGQEQCQRCGEDGYDRRTLWMRCFYAMDELKIPFSRQGEYFTLRVCKDCRAGWMGAIKTWFNEPQLPKESPGSGIFVRENGATVEISENEWKHRYPNREPIKILPQPADPRTTAANTFIKDKP